jgi:hypothetical protein
VLVIRAEGLEIAPQPTLPWKTFKDALVFTYDGEKTIGLRLRDDLDPQEVSEIAMRFGRSPDWQLLGMPLAMSFSELSLSGQDILTQLQKHGLKITVSNKAVRLGHKPELT